MRRFTLQAALVALCLIISPTTTRASDADELREKAKAIRQEAMKLAQSGNEKEADQLFQESKLLLEKAEEISKANREQHKQKPNENRALDEHVRHLKQHINELVTQQKKLKQEGAPDSHLQELRAMIAAKETELKMIRSSQSGHLDIPPAFRPQAEKLEALSRRVHHMRVAAENLKLADAHDMAHQIMEKAEHMERELHEGKQRLAAEINHSHQKQEGLDIVRDLHAELEQLRREVKELRQQIERQ